jgi:8-oxo-dGTP diphosphatase
VYIYTLIMSTLQPTYTDDIFNLSIPVLAVYIVLFTLYRDELCVVLVPGRNEWAHGKLTLPGGIIWRGETLDEAADRILKRDTNIEWVYKEQLYTFSAHNRDDRGDVISCSYYTLVWAHEFLSQIDLTRVSLVPYEQVSWDTVAYDHAEIIAYAYQRLKWKMEYTNVVKSILPEKFTLRALQEMYENIFKKPFDKRNFRKKILSLDMLIETDEWDKENSKRPAKLYAFSDTELKIIGII